MIEPGLDDRWAELARAVRQLMHAETIDAAVEIVRRVGRAIAGADGIAIVRRKGDRCAYIAEDSIAPLWAGRDFPMDECVSGKAMLRARPILVEDIAQSDDVPLNLYLATYVRRLAVFPFGVDPPIGTLCAYWRDEGPIDDESARLLAALARAMGGVFETLFVLEQARSKLRSSGNSLT